MKVGITVFCEVCGLPKAPRGRSVPMGSVMCDHECEGYDKPPFVGPLHVGETESDYGYPVGPHGWEEKKNDQTRD